MSLAVVGTLAAGKSTTSGVATLALTPTVNAGAGHLLVLIANASAGRTLSSVTDTKSNTWTVGPNPGGASTNGVTAWTQQDGGALTTTDTITITFSGTGANKVGAVIEISGQDTTTPIDSGVTNTALVTTTTPSVTAAGATAIANEVIIGGFAWQGTAQRTFTQGTGYTTQVEQDETSSAFLGVAIEYQIVSSTGTYTAAGTVSGTVSSASQTILGVRGGSSIVNGTATDALTSFGGSATGTVTKSGTATDATTSFGGSATGSVTKSGTATDALTTFGGSATGSSGFFGTATDALTAFRGSATGTVTKSGTATDALTSFGGSAVGTFTPPIGPIQQPGNRWETYLCDRFGYPIQNISRVCFGKQLTQTLNQPSSFSFWAPSSDSRIAGLHTDGNPYLMEGRAIRVYRNGTLVFTGHLWQVEDTGDDVAVKTAVTCFDPLQWLSRRVARQMIYQAWSVGTSTISLYITGNMAAGVGAVSDSIYAFSSAFGVAATLFVGGTAPTATDIARGVLNAANDYDGFTGLDDFYLSSAYRPNNATPSLCTNQTPPAANSVTTPFSNSRASDILATLVGQNGSFDIEVVPTDVDFYSAPNHTAGGLGATFQQAYPVGSAADYASIHGSLTTKPWKTLALLKYWAPTRGASQPNVVFGYGTYPHNIQQIDYLTDLSELTNNSRMMANQFALGAVNTTSVQTYGAGMDVQSLADITDATLLEALAVEEATLGGNAKRTLQITPVGGTRTPLPFDNFNIGDQVSVNAGVKLRGGFTGSQRIYGFTLDINDDHTTETLTNLVTSPQTAF